MPTALVGTVVVLWPLKVPVAPEVGAVKSTETPATGLPEASRTWTPKGGKGLLMRANWLPGVSGVILPALPGVVFVRAKVAGWEMPAAVADTVKLPVVPLAVRGF